MNFGDENVTSIELLLMTEPPDDTVLQNRLFYFNSVNVVL